MPKPVQQVAKPVRKKANGEASVLERIAPVRVGDKGLRINVYGRGKTGKTRLFSTFPKPALIIGTEDGTLSVTGIKGLDFVQANTTEEVGQLTEMLKEGKYRSACIDTAGGLSDLAIKEVLGLDEIPIQRTYGMAKRDDWMAANVQVKERLRLLLVLAETHSLNIMVVAHERNFKDDGAEEVLAPTIGAALTPGVAGWLNGACDYVCQTFIREQMVSKKVSVGGQVTELLQPTGIKEYCLRVGPHPLFMTGFRLPPGIELPESIVSPSYTKLIKLIKGEEVK